MRLWQKIAIGVTLLIFLAAFIGLFVLLGAAQIAVDNSH
jgi:hypothetical protein